MSIERKFLLSVLKLTKETPTLIESIKTESRLPDSVCNNLLEKLQNESMVYFKTDNLELDSLCRIKIAIKAASLGADIQDISNYLHWQEFEELAAVALKNNGYTVHNNVHFTHEGHRWEIDVVACRKPLVLCIDCKRWHHAITPSALNKIVKEQTQRTQALTNSLPNRKNKFECTQWETAKFIPAILSLMPCSSKFHNKVPVVPVLQLQNFISQLPVHTENVCVFQRKFEKLTSNF